MPLPKDATHFRRERVEVIRRALEVCEARPLTTQAETMQDELDISLRSDYTTESLPLLLHQVGTYSSCNSSHGAQHSNVDISHKFDKQLEIVEYVL